METQYKTKTLTYDNAIVRVHIPILDEEREHKRMQRIKDATARFMKEVEKCKREKTKT